VEVGELLVREGGDGERVAAGVDSVDRMPSEKSTLGGAIKHLKEKEKRGSCMRAMRGICLMA